MSRVLSYVLAVFGLAVMGVAILGAQLALLPASMFQEHPYDWRLLIVAVLAFVRGPFPALIIATIVMGIVGGTVGAAAFILVQVWRFIRA